MANMKTPGVYIVEKSAFPNSVVQVATAVPAFIGYTERAVNGNQSLHMVARRITSMSEFAAHYGGPPEPAFEIADFAELKGPSPLSADGAAKTDPLPRATFTTRGPRGPEVHELVQKGPAFTFWSAMKLFFENGGGPCYIVSIGDYRADAFDAQKMKDAIDLLKKEAEPTMLVIPEATRLARQECVSVQQAMLKHCGFEMRNRFAILDIFAGHLAQGDPLGNPVAVFRNDIGINQLDFGAAYFPWVDTSIYSTRSFSYLNIDPASRGKLIGLMKRSIGRNEEVAREIERITAPVLSGDFTLSLPKGQTTIITEEDIKATDDDTTDLAKITYDVVGEAAAMGGQVVKTDGGAVITSFTQADLAEGKVSFKHDGTTPVGKFDVIVKDQEGIATDAREIKVEVVGAVLDIAAVATGNAVPIDVSGDHEGGDFKTLKLQGADDAEGQTLTQPGVGVWTADGKGKVTFTPDPEFPGPEATASYTLAVAEATAGPFELKVIVTGGPLAKIVTDGPTPEGIDKTLRAVVPLYGDVMEAITKRMNAMPPAAAMAGIYTMVDSARGVWKAPANVSLNSVVAPKVNINHEEQENLNVSTTGKSINAIRPFVGEGTLVWGARTLDGNSLDWRYINVRRTMIMIEESIRLASKAYVFEPNTASTWVTMRSMIENFLTSVWKQGGLAGSSPADAFSVHVGLGETMTPVDILEGILRITVLVAVVRPAEFIEITFMQQMQKS